MKLKNCLGFLFYLHSLSLSPFSLTLALALPLSVLLSYPANGISGYCIFFPAVLRNFPTSFSPVLASPLRQAPQTHFKRFLGCGEGKGYGGSVLYLCWVTVWAAIKETAAAAHSTWLGSTWGTSFRPQPGGTLHSHFYSLSRHSLWPDRPASSLS